MNKNLGTRTATTYTLVEQFPGASNLDADAKADLARPYTWKNEDAARDAITMMIETNGFEHTEHAAPGLEVHAFYVNGDLLTVIVFEDDTAVRLNRAVRKAQPVTVTYVRADGEEIVRTIEPRSLKLTKSGDVIVKALDRASGEHRSFRLDRLLSLTVHRTRFLVPEPVKAELTHIECAVCGERFETVAQSMAHRHMQTPVEPVVGFTLWAGEFYGTVDGLAVTPGTDAKAQALAGAYASRRTFA